MSASRWKSILSRERNDVMRMEESSRANPAGGTQNSTSLFVDCWPDRVQISFATLINLKYNGHSQRGKEATSRARLEHS